MIGINKYRHWTVLQNAVNDVQRIRDVLCGQYRFDPDPSCTTVLLDADATEKNILNELRKLVEKVTENDNLVIFFSGHGYYDKVTQTGYWIPVDAETGDDNAHQFIDSNVIIHRVSKINSLHTFLVIDACFSGSFLKIYRGGDAPYSKLENLKSRMVLTSGEMEKVSDGPPGGNSPFTTGILKSLDNTGADVTITDLVTGVRKYISQNSPEQTPLCGILQNTVQDYGEMVFRRKGSDRSPGPAAGTVSPSGPAPAAALPADPEKTAWEEANQDGTYVAYRRFSSKFPSGKYTGKALKKMLELEETAYEEVRKNPVFASYQSFVSRHPDSRFNGEAEAEMKKLDKKALDQIKNQININRLKENDANRMQLADDIRQRCIRYLENFQGADNFLEVRKILNNLMINLAKKSTEHRD